MLGFVYGIRHKRQGPMGEIMTSKGTLFSHRGRGRDRITKKKFFDDDDDDDNYGY